MPSVPKYADKLSDDEVNYLANLRVNKNFNVIFLREDKKILLRNCDTFGNLLDLTLPLVQLPEKPWVMMSIRKFCVQNCEVDVPVCSNCSENVQALSTNQSYESLASSEVLNKIKIYNKLKIELIINSTNHSTNLIH